MPRIRSDSFSANITTGAFKFPVVILGMTDASTTRRPFTALTQLLAAIGVPGTLPNEVADQADAGNQH